MAEEPAGKKHPYRFYADWPMLGLLVATFVVFWLLMYRPTGGRIRESARIAGCKSRLRQLALACRAYAADYSGELPPSLEALLPAYLDNSKLLTCNGAQWRKLPVPHYTYVPDLRADMPGSFIVAYDELANHGKNEKTGELAGRNVAFLDAHVEWSRAGRDSEFQERLAEQREAVRKWRAAGAKKEDMNKFFGKLREKWQE